jgi:hypothetical protein
VVIGAIIISGCTITININIDAKDTNRNRQSGLVNKMTIKDTTKK